MKKRISVITINYNNLNGLRATLNSVIEQDYSSIEYIIIDGGSTDGSAELIHSVSGKIYYWASEKDSGVYQAMNKGIVRATGDYIIFLNSGDLFFDNQTVSKCCRVLDEIESVDVLYGNMYVVNQLNQIDHLYCHPEKLTLKFFKNDTINHQSTLIKRSLFEEFGLYPEKYKLASDYWLYIVCLLAGKKYFYLEIPLVIYDFSGMSASNNFKDYKIEQKQIWENIVPHCVQDLVINAEKIESDLAYHSRTINYKIVKAAITLNEFLQKFKTNKKI